MSVHKYDQKLIRTIIPSTCSLHSSCWCRRSLNAFRDRLCDFFRHCWRCRSFTTLSTLFTLESCNDITQASSLIRISLNYCQLHQVLAVSKIIPGQDLLLLLRSIMMFLKFPSSFLLKFAVNVIWWNFLLLHLIIAIY